MTTYANIKLPEVFVLYGNPFTRGSCKKNSKEKIMSKYYKKMNFEEIVKEIKQEKTLEEGNSQINLINKQDNGLLILKNNTCSEQKNYNKSLIKLAYLFPQNGSIKYSSKFNLNTDVFSVSSRKKRTQQELIKKTRANYTSEENVDNTKLSSIVFNRLRENISHISQNNHKE